MTSAKCDCQKTRIAAMRRCEPEDAHKSLRTLVRLMQEPISTSLYERQIMIFKDFLRATTSGYCISDLPYIIRLIDLVVELLDDICLFSTPYKLFLSKCEIPPTLSRTSEAMEYFRDLEEYFTCLGYLLIRVKENEMLNLIIQAICELLRRTFPVGNTSVPLEFRQKAAEQSNLPVIIAHLLQIADEELYEKLLEIAIILVKISPFTCQKMISEQAINHLLIRLDPKWETRDILVFFSYEDENGIIQNLRLAGKILWLLLQSFKRHESLVDRDSITPNRQALWSLRYALRILTSQKHNGRNRNHVMGIFLQCLDLFSNMCYFYTGLVNDLLILSVANEMGTGGTWASRIRFTSQEEDYEFKKMLIHALCYCANNAEALKILLPKRILPGLLKIVTPELSNIWVPQQHNKLISIALYAIQSFVPNLINEFVYCDGPLRLLILIDFYNVEPYDLTILGDCLKCLRAIISIGAANILDNIMHNDGFQILSNLCERLLSAEILLLSIQSCLANAFTILEILCRSKNFHGSIIVTTCMEFIHRVIQPKENDPILDPNFVICGIDYIWEGVIWHQENCKKFVSLGGVFKFLDMLLISIYPVRLIALGVLADLCDDGNCVPHIITWRGNKQKLMPLLLEIFREENLKLGVKTTESGAIGDIEAPLMGVQQWYETFYEDKDPNSSPATVDLLASCRPKIYAVIQLVSVQHHKRVNIAHEHYRMFIVREILTTQNKMTCLLAENFLALKLGEAWVELSRDLEKAGIRPLSVDGEIINILKRRYHRWSRHLQAIQYQDLHQHEKIQCIKEKIFYNLLKETKLGDSLQALRELDYIARTTERMFRYLAKMKQVKEVDSSLEFAMNTTNHKTFMRGPKITTVFNLETSVQSNIIAESEYESAKEEAVVKSVKT